MYKRQLQDINLNIPANHATALIGPSGCGKSTFVRCLNRMHETNPIARATGTIKIGEDVYKRQAEARTLQNEWYSGGMSGNSGGIPQRGADGQARMVEISLLYAPDFAAL